jgi:hypothetical protein
MSTSAIFAQPEIDWIHTYDAGRTEGFADIYASSDGGYVMCGSLRNQWISPDTTLDAWMVKIDGEGNEQWSRNLGAPLVEDYATSIIETDFQEFLTVGRSNGRIAAWLVDANGAPIWRHTYQVGIANAVIELKAGDYVIAGSFNHHAYLLCINHDGQVIWDHSYGAAESDRFEALREKEGGIVAAGASYFNDRAHHWQVLLVKADFNGEPIWLQNLAPRDDQYCYSMVSRPGGFVLSGMYWSGNMPADEDYMWMSVDNDGNLTAEERYDLGLGYESAWSIIRLDNAGYAMVGFDYDNNIGENLHPQVIVVNPNGAVRWSQNYRMADIEGFAAARHAFKSVIRGHDGSIIAAGYATTDEQIGPTDGLLMKLQPEVLEPQFVFWLPRDTVLTVLQGDSITFTVHVHGPQGDVFHYDWTFDDSLFAHDTTTTVVFDSLGTPNIHCVADNGNAPISITWHVTVIDFFIRSFLPDTTELTLRRGVSQDFSVDVAATPGDPVNYDWWLTDLTERHDSLISDQANASYNFLLSGDYRLSATAYRGESSDTTGWLIHVKSVVQAFWPRNLNFSAHPDTTINFGVLPFNQQSDSLHYLWLKNGVQIDTLSEVAISFPDSGMQAITAIVMDGSEGDTLNWVVNVSQVTGVRWQGVSGIPSELTLYPPSPNPFNSMTSIRFGLDKSAPTRLVAYDLAGREVSTLVNERLEAGEHRASWSAAGVGSGLYFVRLEASGQIAVRKMMVVK